MFSMIIDLDFAKIMINIRQSMDLTYVKFAIISTSPQNATSPQVGESNRSTRCPVPSGCGRTASHRLSLG